jgi:peptide chain release factor 1
MLDDPDEDIRALATEEIAEAEQTLEAVEAELQILLLPRDP